MGRGRSRGRGEVYNPKFAMFAVARCGVGWLAGAVSHGDVARAYEELAVFHAVVMGRRVHHGCWGNGARSLAEALVEMEREITEFARIGTGMRVCDVGCGYGMMAADWQAQGVRVTGVTNSQVQAEFLHAAGIGCHKGDWMEYDAGGEFDRVVAVESLEHFHDPAAALRRMKNVLREGGEVVLACWTVERGTFPERLLETIIHRSGKLHGLCDAAGLWERIAAAGLRIEETRDLSACAGRTWGALAWEALRAAGRDAGFRKWCVAHPVARAAAALGVIAAELAYATGAAQYHLIRGVCTVFLFD